MTDTPADPAPAQDPAVPAREPWLAGLEHDLSRLFPGHPAGVPYSGDLGALIRSHAAGVLAHAAHLLAAAESSPEVKALLPEVLQLAGTAAQLAGVTL